MTQIVHRNIRLQMPTAQSGNGVFIYDAQGKEYIDASGGAAVSSLGHGHPAPIRAIKQQADKLAYIHSGFFTSEVAENLAQKLISIAPDSLDGVILVSGGSESMESALKLAKQYFVEHGDFTRKYFISRNQSYHGSTLGALSVGNNEARKRPYRPLLLQSHAISPCNPYRGKIVDETDQEYCNRVAGELEQKILQLGAENVIGFVAETVGGATSGVTPPVQGYFKRIREICDNYGILLVLDEVMCGSGRCGTFFSFTQDEIVPDIVCIAKGLGGGYQPIGAVVCSRQIHESIRQGSGTLANGFTYMGHAIAAAAALAVLQTIESDHLLANVQRQGQYLMKQLHKKLDSHPHVGDIRGRGLFVGIEFVADKATKQPLDPKLQFHAHLKRVCLQNGMLCYPGGGTVDGHQGDHALLAPPYIVDETICDRIISIFSDSIDASLAETGIRI